MCKLVEDPGTIPASGLSVAEPGSVALLEPEFGCTWSRGGGETAWVWPVGELDRETLPLLDEALTPAFSAARMVVLDLRALSFLDVVGAQFIVDAGARASLSGRRLILIRGPAQVQRVFAVTGMAEAVETVDVSQRPSGVQSVLRLVAS
jgi:anti-anti-sigma factor